MPFENLRRGFRLMARNPGFSAAAVLTLALGIGANTALFNVLDEALLRPLPVSEPARLAAVFNFDRSTAKYISTSYPDYLDYSRRARSFERLSAYVRLPLNLKIGADTERVPVEAVTANYFDMLRLPPAAGRSFRPEDDLPGAAPAAMISETLWRARYGGDPGVVGKAIALAEQTFFVVGIVPARYRGANLNWSDPPQVWIPLSSSPLAVPQFRQADIFNQRSMRWLLVLGRLKNGVPVAAAQAELRLVAGELGQSEPAADRDVTVAAFPVSRAKFWPGFRAPVTQFMAVLGGAAGLVLLLACANVSNLLLERAFSRRREFAIRLALGASRGRLIGQLLAENLVLAAPGFLLALPVAWGLGRVLLRFPNAFGLGLALQLETGGRALAFCSLASLAATLLFGLAPALRSARPDIQAALKASGNTAAPVRRDWLRSRLVVVQVAFSMVLLVAGGLFARTLLKAYAVDPGFRPSNLLIVSFNPAPGQFAGERGRRWSEALLERISGLGGVEAASLAWTPPLTPVRTARQVTAAESAQAPLSVLYNMVGPAYLRTMGIGLAGGRDFDARDGSGSGKVAIVNQALARRLWGRGGAVGRTIVFHEKGGRRVGVEVVGVARDSRYGSLWEPAEPYIYVPAAQWDGATATLLVRTRPEPRGVIPVIRREWREIAPGVPLTDFRTGPEQVNASLAPQRVAAGLLGCFGALAVVLAAIGLYGVVAFTVAQRTREIGIRMALGAAPGAVVGNILRDALALAAAGVAAGAAVSAALLRLAASLVRGVSTYDAATYAAVAVLLAAISLGAAVVPALRAARVDPLTALKYE
jgi:predicted permease